MPHHTTLSSCSTLLMKNVTLPSTSNSSAASPSIASSSVINALPLYFANCFRAPDRICSTCSPFPLVTLYQSKYLKCAIKVMANAADMLLTCVMNAGLITKLRELCPLPCGLFLLFSCSRDRVHCPSDVPGNTRH